MKVYTRIVWDIETLQILEAEFYEYEGPWALCDFGVLEIGAIIAAVAAVVGAATGGYAAVKAGQNANYMAQYNAMMAQISADEKRKQAAYAADREREKNEQIRARQRLAFNLSGVTPEGTPTDLLSDTAARMELDAQAIMYGGNSSGTAEETKAQLLRQQGKVAESAGWWNAGSTILSGASSTMNAYTYKGYNPGLVSSNQSGTQ